MFEYLTVTLPFQPFDHLCSLSLWSPAMQQLTRNVCNVCTKRMPFMAAYMTPFAKRTAPWFKTALKMYYGLWSSSVTLCHATFVYMNLSLLIFHLINPDKDVPRAGLFFSPMEWILFHILHHLSYSKFKQSKSSSSGEDLKQHQCELHRSLFNIEF